MKLFLWSLVLAFVLILPLRVSAVEMEMPPEVEGQIKETYATGEEYTADELSIRSFGQYEGCWVFFMDGPFDYPSMEDTEEVSGLEFWYPSAQKLLVYRDGTILKLADAYEAGWLTDGAVAQLWQVYSDGNPKTGDGVGAAAVVLLLSATGFALMLNKRRW